MNEIHEHPLWARPYDGAEDIEVKETDSDFRTLTVQGLTLSIFLEP